MEEGGSVWNNSRGKIMDDAKSEHVRPAAATTILASGH
jgi:hypothetical protein